MHNIMGPWSGHILKVLFSFTLYIPCSTAGTITWAFSVFKSFYFLEMCLKQTTNVHHIQWCNVDGTDRQTDCCKSSAGKMSKYLLVLLTEETVRVRQTHSYTNTSPTRRRLLVMTKVDFFNPTCNATTHGQDHF